MARTTRASTRLDVTLFLVALTLAVVTNILPGNLREPLAGALRQTVVAPLITMQRGAERWRGAWVQSERLTLRADSAALRAFAVPALQRENEELRQLLGLGSRLEWGFIPAEALSARAREGDFTLLLTAGSNAGVVPMSPVVSPEGLVGLVQSVDPRMSMAITIQHPMFRVSAMTADGAAYGIVGPHLTNATDPRRSLLQLRGVPFRSIVKPGTLVFASGLANVHPNGVTIGTVLGEVRTPEAWTRTYLVRAAANPATVSAVMIMKPERARAGVGNVWASTLATDSAMRSIASAGDSIARTRLVAAAAARRATYDSLNPPGTAQDSAARAAGAAVRDTAPPPPGRPVATPRTSVTLPPRTPPRPDTTPPDTTLRRPR